MDNAPIGHKLILGLFGITCIIYSPRIPALIPLLLVVLVIYELHPTAVTTFQSVKRSISTFFGSARLKRFVLAAYFVINVPKFLPFTILMLYVCEHVSFSQAMTKFHSVQSTVSTIVSNEFASKASEQQNPPRVNRIDADSNQCNICCERPKDIVLRPCRHLYLCGDCLPRFREHESRCPICRQPFKRTMRIFNC